jgi:hypothetical protein
MLDDDVAGRSSAAYSGERMRNRSEWNGLERESLPEGQAIQGEAGL